MKEEKPVPKIQKTLDYSKFTLQVRSNRPVSNTRVKKLTTSFKQKDDGRLTPCIVNNKNEVVAGRHRFVSRQELGLPIYYILDNDITTEDIRRMDKYQSKWSKNDIVESYISEGNEEYKKLKEFNLANGLNYESACKITTKNNSTIAFEEGKYKFDNLGNAIRVMMVVNKLAELNYVHSHYCRCILGIDLVLKCRDFDMDTFLKRLKSHLHKLPLGGTKATEFGARFVEIYNFYTVPEKQIALNIIEVSK